MNNKMLWRAMTASPTVKEHSPQKKEKGEKRTLIKAFNYREKTK